MSASYPARAFRRALAAGILDPPSGRERGASFLFLAADCRSQSESQRGPGGCDLQWFGSRSGTAARLRAPRPPALLRLPSVVSPEKPTKRPRRFLGFSSSRPGLSHPTWRLPDGWNPSSLVNWLTTGAGMGRTSIGSGAVACSRLQAGRRAVFLFPPHMSAFQERPKRQTSRISTAQSPARVFQEPGASFSAADFHAPHCERARIFMSSMPVASRGTCTRQIGSRIGKTAGEVSCEVSLTIPFLSSLESPVRMG